MAFPSFMTICQAIFRNFVVDGVPASGLNNVSKAEARAMGSALDLAFASVLIGGDPEAAAEFLQPYVDEASSAAEDAATAAVSIPLAEQAVSLTLVEAPNQVTEAELAFTSKVLVSGNADTAAGAYEDLGCWILTSGAGLQKSWTRRFSRSAFGDAATVSASILIQHVDPASAGAGKARFMIQQRTAALAEITGARAELQICDQAGLTASKRVRHSGVALHVDCAHIDIYLDLSAAGSTERRMYFREMLTARGPNGAFRFPPTVVPKTVYVGPTGNNVNAGTRAAPLATLDAAADMLGGVGSIVLLAGEYSWTTSLNRLTPSKVIDLTIIGERGVGPTGYDRYPLIRTAAKLTGITKTAGRAKVYQVAMAAPGTSANFNWAFQDGVADPRTVVTSDEMAQFPELRGRTHWLPNFALILDTQATALAAALAEIDASPNDDPRGFLDDSTNIFYFSIVGGGDGAAANIYWAANGGPITTTASEGAGTLRFENVEIRYGQLDVRAFKRANLNEVAVLGSKTDCVLYSNLTYGTLETAAGGALIALTGDGLNGHGGAKCNHGHLFSHHNNDDGRSPHEGSSDRGGTGLLAYNGGSALAIAYGADAVCGNYISYRNQRRIDPTTPANRYKPGAFAVVGDPADDGFGGDGGNSTSARFRNCISIEDYVGFYSDDAVSDRRAYGVAVDCKAIRPVTQGFNVTKVVDCSYLASGTSSNKAARTVVENTVLVS